MNKDVAREIAHRDAANCERVTLGELRRRLHAIGYTLDRALDCACIARTISPPERAGETCPTITGYVIEKDTRVSAANVNARRQTARLRSTAGVGRVSGVNRDSLGRCPGGITGSQRPARRAPDRN